jgi:outer membrane protein assembly factor BamE (lipoprotein component of BamABCDE complex)
MLSASSPRRRWVAALTGVALLPALSTGCATRGAEFPVDKIPRIEKGATTREEVEGWFGRPVSLEQRPSGFAVYRYLHEEETSRDTGIFSRIARFVAGFFGYRGYGSPVNVRYENRVRHELIVTFDPNGIVSSYGYERTEIPTKRIY